MGRARNTARAVATGSFDTVMGSRRGTTLPDLFGADSARTASLMVKQLQRGDWQPTLVALAQATTNTAELLPPNAQLVYRELCRMQTQKAWHEGQETFTKMLTELNTGEAHGGEPMDFTYEPDRSKEHLRTNLLRQLRAHADATDDSELLEVTREAAWYAVTETLQDKMATAFQGRADVVKDMLGNATDPELTHDDTHVIVANAVAPPRAPQPGDGSSSPPPDSFAEPGPMQVTYEEAANMLTHEDWKMLVGFWMPEPHAEAQAAFMQRVRNMNLIEGAFDARLAAHIKRSYGATDC